jgi:hypothetical protein
VSSMAFLARSRPVARTACAAEGDWFALERHASRRPPDKWLDLRFVAQERARRPGLPPSALPNGGEPGAVSFSVCRSGRG